MEDTLKTEPPVLDHQPCPYCDGKASFNIWADGSFKCHKCGAVPKTHGRMAPPPETPLESKPLPYRNIKQPVLDKYGTTTGVNPVTGEEIRREYHYPHATKYRYLPKDFSKNAGFTADHLFGMDKFNAGSSPCITIVEGEDDAPAAYQMLNGEYPVVAAPGSTISTGLLRKCHSYLDSFSQIIVCGDGDAAGDKMAKRLAVAFPNKVYRVALTKHNDPQDFLAAGDVKDFIQAWRNRTKHVPSGFFNTPDQFKGILAESSTHNFIPTPITELNDVIKGLMQGHLTVITGPEGQGKTEVLRMFEHHILANYKDKRIGVLHMEETKKTCLESYACYVLGKNIRDPEHEIPQKEIDDAITELTKDENLFLFDFNIDEDPLAIMDKVRYLKEACGCDYVFIDPIQQLSYGKNREMSEEQTLSQISVQLERIATDLNVGIIMSTHVNDDGQTRSSRMIGKSASVRIDLKRDHMNADADIRNRTALSVSKNRPTGKTGYGGQIVFDPDSFTLTEDI